MLCDRCGRDGIAFTTSYFNTDTICLDGPDPCADRERRHPDYPLAKRIEEAAVRAGDFNFPGIGLPADLERREPTT